jgi:hypothetical protein
MARRATIRPDALKAATPPASTVASESAPAAPEKPRGQTLRLNIPAWEQLKILSAKERKTAHDLLLEAVNLLFKERGLPPLA